MATAIDYAALITEHVGIEAVIRPRWTAYIPHEPTAKQIAFLCLDGWQEAFYGGAAGGGKSDALLMAALQYVDIPGYSAIIFRKSFSDLRKSGALIDRSKEWLGDTDARWDSQQHTWYFPSGAQLSFGYLDHDWDIEHYQSAEYQYVAFDELTQQYRDDYLYLFSRLRKLACSVHLLDDKGSPIYVDDCEECNMRSQVPIRMRAASNPGGRGHEWVKERYRIEKVGELYHGIHPDRPHVPAFVTDNPFIDQASYIESLKTIGEYDKVTCERLLKGDWSISHDARFKRSWMRYYTTRGDYIVLKEDGKGPAYLLDRCRIFQTVDPAASAKEGPGDPVNFRKNPSWTVISTWVVTPDGDLCWWDLVRFRKEVPDTIQEVLASFRKHQEAGRQPDFVGIEPNGVGIGVFQAVSRLGLPVHALKPRSNDKLVRATDATHRMAEGKIYLPWRAEWLQACESELFTWTGHKDQEADQIDTLSYAAMMVSSEFSLAGPVTRDDLPTVEV